MPIFGQVWLWSLLAFLLGAVLCWVLVVLPVRRRIEMLESRLASLRADAKMGGAVERARVAERPAEQDPSMPAMMPAFGEAEARGETLTRAYAAGVRDVPATPYPEPVVEDPAERGALTLSAPGAMDQDVREHPAGPTRYVGAIGQAPAGERDWFDEDQPAQEPAAEPDRRLVDDQDDEDRGTIFTQRTEPIPVGLIDRLDESSPGPQHSLVEDRPDEPAEDAQPPAAREGAHALRAEPEPEPEPQPEPVRPPEPTRPPKPARRPAAALDTLAANGSAHGSSDVDTPVRPEPAKPEPAKPEPPVKPDERVGLAATASRPALAELPKRTSESKVLQGLQVQPAASQTALPKRVPSKPQHRHPFGVATVSPATASTSEDGERTRSLFEPILPPEGGDSGEMPEPPHRLQATGSRAKAGTPGPFGPGSAMPLPGGESPSPEFTIKASVAALRYCTPESPQFGRTVAEVWFRTAADAERVGFRPAG
jgi:hypothetical protein